MLEQQAADLARKDIVPGFVGSGFRVSEPLEEFFFHDEVIVGVVHQAFENFADHRGREFRFSV